MLFTCGERHVLISDWVMTQIAQYTTRAEITREAGGVLIGSYRGPHVEVTTCTTPLSGDVRGPVSFDRRDAGHQTAAMRAWRTSGNTETFVGEWHTHPEDHPSPSSIDLQTWSNLLARTSCPLIFLIAGRHSLWCGFGQARDLRRAYEPLGDIPLHMDSESIKLPKPRLPTRLMSSLTIAFRSRKYR
jgi:integrative and conjugative element protein (TIGR02256 family)